MKYILDFDRTLFDTDAFKAQVIKDGRKDIAVTPEIWNFYNAQDYLYEDVLPWLESKKPENIIILTAMYSKGGPAENYQKAKLRSSKLISHVSETIFMVGEKGESVIEIAARFPSGEQIVFVDDKLEQCLSVKKALPSANVCLINRSSQTNIESEESQGVLKVSSLVGVDAIINNI